MAESKTTAYWFRRRSEATVIAMAIESALQAKGLRATLSFAMTGELAAVNVKWSANGELSDDEPFRIVVRQMPKVDNGGL